MHNKYATFVLPVLAGLAIVGAGFSTWVFEQSTDNNATFTGTINVTPAQSDVTASLALTTADTFTLTLDQGTTAENGASYMNDKTVGITASVENVGFTWSIPEEDAKQRAGYNVRLVYSWSLEGYDAVNTYISLDDIEENETAEEFNKDETTVDLSSQENISDGNFVIRVDNSLANTWTYESKPQSFAEYDSMVSAVQGKTLTFTLTVTAYIEAK